MDDFNRTRLSDISSKDRPWDIHRAQAEIVTSYYVDGNNYPHLAERVHSCSTWLEFQLNDKGIKLSRSFFCRVRYCPVCQWRRTMMWKSRALQVIPKLMADYPTARYLFLTLTVKNKEITKLREEINLINKGFKLMTKRKEWPGIGHIKALEVTKGNNGEMMAHPHLHVLIMVNSSYFSGREYVKAERWREIWAECMKLDYTPQVNVKAVRGDVEEAIKEVIKYEAKPEDIVTNGSKWLDALTQQMKKVRRIELSGIMRKYFRELEEEPEDLINVDEETNEQGEDQGDQIRFDWERKERAYLLSEDHS